MTLAEIVHTLDLQVRSGESKLDAVVQGGYVGDLLSDVMANSKEGDIWITRQIHQNIVAVASLKEHAGIILVQGSEPSADTLDKAAKEDIPIMVSELPAFEAIGKVYNLIIAKEKASAP
jgi:predicted transcriptional regulator